MQKPHIVLKHTVSNAATGDGLLFFHTQNSAKSSAKVRLFVGITKKSKKQSTYSEFLPILCTEIERKPGLIHGDFHQFGICE